jgi:hypothetical protein
MVNAVLVCNFFGFVQFATDQGHDLNPINVFDAIQMFDAEGTCARQGDFDRFAHA